MNRAGPLVVVGDCLLDRDVSGQVRRLCPDAAALVIEEPVSRCRPGGAGLAATLAARDAVEIVLVTALAPDPAGQELADLLERAGVTVVDLGLPGCTPEKVRVRAQGRSLLRLDYGGRGGHRPGPLPAAARAALASARSVLLSDYGRGVAAEPSVRRELATVARRVPLVWDPHPRGDDPVAGARLATPNHEEAARLAPGAGGRQGADEPELSAVSARARVLLERWGAAGVAVTLGGGGAVLVAGDGTALAVPATPVDGGDPCGAGDRFAVTAAALLGQGALPSEAVTEAVAAASAYVAAGGAAALFDEPAHADPSPPEEPPSAAELARRVRAAGGTVVATGGCFDLLHAGHVRMLEGARALGDCLIVCLNSDRSVRRLKGPGRPLVPEADRAAVLRGLACVDAVAVFDEDTPQRILTDLRPQLWAKGADYAVADLPEAPVVRRWGGEAVVMPYVPGRSTTRLIQEAVRRDHH